MSNQSFTVLVLSLVVAGCAAGDRPPLGPGTDAGTSPPPMTDAWVPPPFDAGVIPDVDASATCASVSVTADPITAPVDVVWVIDSSGSMRDEARRVQDNMNRFSTDISSSGVDHHVVVITDPAYVTVPPPLGTDAERYRFVARDVGSEEPLQRLLSELPRYRDFLRPGASTHFIVVTDDDSDMSASAFESQMTSALGHGFTLHAIASPGDQLFPCLGGLAGIAAAPGREYWTLASRTGGLRVSICTSDWSALFTELRDAVVVSAALPCLFSVPAAPAGMTFDRDLVNVVFTPDAGIERTIPRVDGPSACAARGGWYYDDSASPSEILLCSATCDEVGTTTTAGRIDIALGCETVLF